MPLTPKDLIETQKIYNGRIISLRVDTLKFHDGRPFMREVIEHPGGVVIAAQPDPQRVILIRQYRYCLNETLIELPAGRIDHGEKPLECGMRELTEETGYKAMHWQEMSRMYTAPGFCNEMLYLFQAQDLTFVGKNLDEDEETDVFMPTLEEAWQLVLSREICDAKTIAGIGLLVNRL